jgi:hypothetical protein
MISLKRALWLVLPVLISACGEIADANSDPIDASHSYLWQPVRIGAGGWVVGFVAHPTATSVRYARTDVGNAYRWDSARHQWAAMKVVNADHSGFPSQLFSAPSPGGVQSIAVDPSDPAKVYLAAPNIRSADIGKPSGINIYRSADGGKSFKAGNLSLPGDANDNWRMYGERLRVDPRNGKVLYFGTGFAPSATVGNGLYRSIDGGATWNPVVAHNAFLATDNIVNVVIDPKAGLTTGRPFGSATGNVSKLVWARGGHMVGNHFWSDLYRSQDGGMTWTDVATDEPFAGAVGELFLDSAGALYSIQNDSKTIWRFADSRWAKLSVESGDLLNGLAIDPKNPKRMFAIGNDASVTRSVDAGMTWTNFGRLQYSNTLGWLPQVPGNAQAYGYRSTGGIEFDAAGNLWVCQGNEGMLRYTPSPANVEDSAHPPKWTINSEGIEEFVTHDIIVPKGSGDRLYTAVEDATGMVVKDPDTFSAVQIPLQTDLISLGAQVAACPNDPKTVAVSTSVVYANGKNSSGITFDAGRTWMTFPSVLRYSDQWGTHDVQAGSIAISARATWGPGDDHIVQLPVTNFVPIYSKDGGRTWTATKSFPTESNGLSFKNGSGYQGYWIFAVKQRQLYADPFVPDKFYLKLVNSPAGLYVSTDGGGTWTGMNDNGLPGNTHHGQLAVNYNVKNDLWFVDGFEGANTHGLVHSSDGGRTFSKLPGISNAITLSLGAGTGKSKDQPYTVYFYGKFDLDPNWGIFRSVDGGSVWERISYYPAGIFDQPTCMAASWDTFGKVYVGFSGNSYVYGRLKPSESH